MKNYDEQIEKTNEQIEQLQNKKKKLILKQSEEKRMQRQNVWLSGAGKMICRRLTGDCGNF